MNQGRGRSNQHAPMVGAASRDVDEVTGADCEVDRCLWLVEGTNASPVDRMAAVAMASGETRTMLQHR